MSVTKNGTTTQFGYDSDNPDVLTSYGNKAITYNANGGVSSYDGWDYTWSKGKLSSIRKSSGGSSRAVIAPVLLPSKTYSFTYNAFGQRTGKSYSYFLPNGAIVSIQTGEVTYSTKQYRYDQSGRLITELINETRYGEGEVSKSLKYLYDESGMIGVQYTNGANTNTYYYLRNLQGDVIGIYNTSGAKVASYTYDAFGNCTTTNAALYDIAYNNPIRYRGYYYDRETNFYYLNSRYYNPEWRRFISPANASAFNPQTVNGLNLYCYANNNPVGVVCDGLSAGINTHSVSTGYIGYLISSVGAGDSTSNSNLLPIPGLVDLLSTAIDHTFAILNPIRTSVYLSKYSGLWDLMRLDGITELPGALSKVATGVGWGLGVLGGVFTGYDKYASGASIESSVAGALIDIKYNIGTMFVSSSIVTSTIAALAGSCSIPGGILIVSGALASILIAEGMQYLLTEMNILGKTYQQHENDFVDWLIWWD